MIAPATTGAVGSAANAPSVPRPSTASSLARCTPLDGGFASRLAVCAGLSPGYQVRL